MQPGRVSLAALLLLCAAVGGSYADEAGATIFQTTLMDFRVTGDATSNFTNTTQNQFSNQLRAALLSYNFMSIAVQDYQAGDGYVDVTVRIVDATDGRNLTQAWSTISSQVVGSNSFVTAFNALLLTVPGLKANATLVSVAGADSKAGVNVSFNVDMTVSGGSAGYPLSDQEKQQLLTPITSFLGDHGTANFTNSTTTNSAANLTLAVTLDANTMPQFWLFIRNQTTLQESLPQLGGSSLSIAVGDYQYVGEQAAAAPGPASGPAQPPVTQAQAQAPISAAQAAGSVAAPPVSSAASGTATLTITLMMFGSDIQPFTPEVQFAAASSLAGVFWIVVGTGSVKLLSYQSVDGAKETSSTFTSSAQQQYGRRLLQATNSSSNGTKPAEQASFSVTLPSATQNSLLVLNSQSPEVRRQFAGWYVQQMASRGYNIDADVMGVNLTAVAAPAPVASAAAASSQSGSSTNVGAIVGGVIGGVCAVALAALLIVWLNFRNQRRRDLMAKEAAINRDSPDYIKAHLWGNNNTAYDLYTKDADAFKKTVNSTLSSGTSFMSSDTPLYRSPLYSRITELDSAHVDDVKRLLHKRKQKESRPLTETSEQQAAALLSALSTLEPGSLYYDKYVVEQGQRRGPNSIIVFAHTKAEPHQAVIIKFVPDNGLYKHEKLFYENRAALEGASAADFLPALFDTYSGSHFEDLVDDDAIPPSIVLERASFTLSDWLSGKAAMSQDRPQELESHRILLNLCRAIEFLHARSLVHGGLTPSTVAWFAPQQKWKLLGFGNWARSKELLRVNYHLRYAAPELLLADLGGMQQLAASEATDMWALGCIAFELLSGHEIFGDQYSEEEIMSMLLGFVKLPWEENPEFFTDHLPVAGRSFVADLLQRSPEARKPIRTALLSPLFTDVNNGGADAPATELHTPANIMSTASEWV